MESKTAKGVLKRMKLDTFSPAWLVDSKTSRYVSTSDADLTVVLDGEFTAEQLEAIAAWMKRPKAVFEG